MAIGKRIRFFRNRKGMTQKQLGEILGFLGKTSDVRMAQYETEARTPKHDLVKEMAGIFDISTHALTVPDIDTYIGLMHTLFALEDMYGLKIGEIDGEICLRLDKSDYSTYSAPFLKLCCILPYPVRGCNAVLGIIFHFILFPPPSSAILVIDH